MPGTLERDLRARWFEFEFEFEFEFYNLDGITPSSALEERAPPSETGKTRDCRYEAG